MSESKKKSLHQHAISVDGDSPAIYGPVPSRRHGISLGINLGDSDQKICTWGCIYCQCGIGRRGYPAAHGTVPEVADLLLRIDKCLESQPDIQAITLAGNSEPTSHPQFREFAQGLRALREKRGGMWKLVVLSNGSEIERSEVMDGLVALDEVWVKLDCATEDLYRRLNRPLENQGGVRAHVSRIMRLGRPRIQTMIWDCPSDARLSNNTTQNIDALVEIFSEVQPLEVHLTTLSRVTAVAGLWPVSPARLAENAESIRSRVPGLKLHEFY